MISTCFDCGKESKIHRHHFQYKPENTAPLCPACHRRRHSGTTVPWTEVLSDEQREVLYGFLDEKDKKLENIRDDVLSKAHIRIGRLSKPVEATYQRRLQTKLNEWGLATLPDEFPLASYPKPIYTLRFYNYLRERTNKKRQALKSKMAPGG